MVLNFVLAEIIKIIVSFLLYNHHHHYFFPLGFEDVLLKLTD